VHERERGRTAAEREPGAQRRHDRQEHVVHDRIAQEERLGLDRIGFEVAREARVHGVIDSASRAAGASTRVVTRRAGCRGGQTNRHGAVASTHARRAAATGRPGRRCSGERSGT
jgi:hypothetical protein